MIMMLATLAAFRLDVEMKHPSLPPDKAQLLVTEGKESTITFPDGEVKVTPYKYANNRIRYRLKIYEKNSGKIKKLSSPEITSRIGLPAEFSENDENGNPKYRIKLNSTSYL